MKFALNRILPANLRILMALVLAFQLSLAEADSDPVAECRQAHADNPTAHIACLEQALNLRQDATGLTPTTAAPAKAAGSEPASALGSEQVLQKQRISGEVSEQPESVRIVASRYDSTELGLFKLANGQIWRETEETPYHLRLKPGQSYEAIIERGKLGGYRMQIDGIKRMLKIERLK